MLSRKELTLFWPFYLDALISPMLFFIPAFFIIYAVGLGFSLFQVSILWTMIPLAMLLFEIPTGAFADIYGRKASVLFGALVQGLGLLLAYVSIEFFPLLLAMALVGLGSTFDSGAREAWIAELGKKELYQKYFAKSQSIDSFALIISGILGSLLVSSFGIKVIFLCGAISFFITLTILSFATENKQKKQIQGSVQRIKKQSLDAIQYIKSSSKLLVFTVATTLLVFGTVFNADVVYIPLLDSLQFPEHAYGYLWSLLGVAGMIAPILSLNLIKKIKELKTMILVFSLASVCFIFLAYTGNIFLAVTMVLLGNFFMRMNWPAERTYLHQHLPDNKRATIVSVQSMLLGLIGVISLPLVGLSVDLLGPRTTLLISATIIIPSALLLLKIKN